MTTRTENADWMPAGDLRFRLVFYKPDFKALFGYSSRTVEMKVSNKTFPKPDYYDAGRAVWTRETIQAHIRAKTSTPSAPRTFGVTA